MLLRLSFAAIALVLCPGCGPAASGGQGGLPVDSANAETVNANSCTVECWKPRVVTLKLDQTKYSTAYLSNQTYYGGFSNNTCKSSSVRAGPAGDPTRQDGMWIWKWSITASAKGPYRCKVSFGSSATGAVVTLHVNLKS
jgi:hypothetical protein